MSRPDHKDIEEGVQPVVDDHLEQPLSTANQPSQAPRGESIFGDSSGPLFSIYSKITEEEDNKMTDRWQKDADGILIFTGLFSASVATLLSVSVQDLRPSSQDTSAFYLQNIYQILADQNLPQLTIPSPIASPPPFSPPRFAVWVNSLWFLSLVISLTCALLATSLHQWARRYVRVTQPARCSPEKRARMRAFFAEGVDKMRVSWAVETLPTLLHLSLFFFFSGLIIFLLNVNHSAFLSVVWWIGLFSVVYICITFMPIFRKDSPYYSPLSTPFFLLPISVLKLTRDVTKLVPFCCVWISVAFCATLYYCFTCIWIVLCSCIELSGRRSTDDAGSKVSVRSRLVIHGGKTRNRFIQVLSYMKVLLDDTVFDSLYRSFERWNRRNAAGAITLRRSLEIDLGILGWTMRSLGEDDALEKFFDAIPGFFVSKLVKVPKIDFESHPRLYIKLSSTLDGFLRRTLSSNSIIESVKNRRLDIYLKANNVMFGPNGVSHGLYQIVSGNFGQLPHMIETANVLARWSTFHDEDIALTARYGVARIFGAIQHRDDRWTVLAREQLGLPDHLLRDNLAHGDNSVLLAIFLHMIRQVFHTDPRNWEIPLSLSNFDIRNTHPGLQNEFCALWNRIVLEARYGYRSNFDRVLRAIRHLYIALHHDIDAIPTNFDPSIDPFERSWYPLCEIATHHPNLAAISPPTQLNDPNIDGPSVYPSHLQQSHPITGGITTPQQAEKTNLV